MKNLKEFLDRLVEDRDLNPTIDPDGNIKTTWCNFAADRTATFMGFDGLHSKAGAPYLANEQFDILSQSRRFVPCDIDEAIKHANTGSLVFAASKMQGHGHICALYPNPAEWSGYFGRKVPIVANVGATNGIMKLSYAFKVCHRPQFFVYVG
jgi:hypothetical protein